MPRGSAALVALSACTIGSIGLLAWQGVTARRTIERLPEAVGGEATHGAGDAHPLHLMVLGDSVAAGVGVADHGQSVAGRLAELLASHGPVRRTVVARSGLTAAGVLALAEESPQLPSADLIVLSVGVNDAKGLHTTARWRRELGALLDAVTTRSPSAHVVLLGVPDMSHFHRLPRPLRTLLGNRSRSLDRAGRVVASAYPAVEHLALDPGLLTQGEAPFAADGFHPSAALHARFAEEIHRRTGRSTGAVRRRRAALLFGGGAPQ